ncbi:MAG: PAS domain S-box protein [Desulfobacteraceae bacterium]|nr:MAG: PAS domain S-box protein [Desulfobacteraceae bacterium]
MKESAMANRPSYEELERRIRDLEEESAMNRQAGESLRLREERYRGLVEDSFDGIFVQEGPKIIYVNKRLNKMLGYLEGELVGQDHWIVYHPDYQALTRERAQARMRGEEPPSQYEVKLRRKDGSFLDGEILARAISLDGKPGVQVWIRDITQRKRAEEALRESEERARRTAQVNSTMAAIGRIISSTLGIKDVYEQFAVEAKKIIPFDRIAMAHIDHEKGTYRYAYTSGIQIPERHEGYTQVFSRIVSEIVQKRSVCLLQPEKEEEFINEYPDFLIPFKAGVRSMMAAPLISRDRVVGVLYLASLRHKLYAERELKLAEEVATQIAGAIAGAQLYAQLKRTEEILREGEKRYRDLYDEAPVGYHSMDGQGRITSINRQEKLMLGYSEEEMIGRPTWNFIVEGEAPIAKEIILAKLAGLLAPSKGLERNFRRRDGTPIPVLIDDRILTDDDGRIIGMLSTIRDDTDRKRTEEEKERLQAQLNQAQKMESVGRLAGGIAHDFNNMLGIIVGNAELAKLQIKSTEPTYRNIEEILKASQRSANLVRQLLAFARKQTVSPKILDLNDTVPGMLKMLRRLIGEDINLVWIPALDLWPVKIDPSQIDQILANLAVNARDAIAGVGKLTIRTGNVVFDEAYCAEHPGSTPGEYVLLAVEDEGAGMSKEALEHLFEPFFTTKEVGKGTGLGLATVYGIVKQNDGFITVQSEPGKGTTFRMYFPRCSERGLVEVSASTAEEEMPQGTETVLLVEDELGILYTTRDLLQMLGYRVLTAMTSTEAMRRTEEHQGEIHLLITDVVMPEMNGRELAERLVSMKPCMKILFMSGYTADVIAHRGVLDPDVHFIEKPFSTKALASKLREVLR